jgi:hypothetical protein
MDKGALIPSSEDSAAQEAQFYRAAFIRAVAELTEEKQRAEAFDTELAQAQAAHYEQLLDLARLEELVNELGRALRDRIARDGSVSAQEKTAWLRYEAWVEVVPPLGT